MSRTTKKTENPALQKAPEPETVVTRHGGTFVDGVRLEEKDAGKAPVPTTKTASNEAPAEVNKDA